MPVDDVDELFEVPPEAFVGARDELAKRLRADGRADEAQEVRRMRRPTVALWSLNQVARRHPQDVDAVLGLADDVRAAQQRRDGERLRAASRDLQAQVAKLVAKAGQGRVAELEGALRTAALQGDPDGELRAGRLRELPEASLDLEMWTAGAEVEAEPAPSDREEEQRAAQLEEAQAACRAAEADVERAGARVEQLEAELDEACIALSDGRARLKAAVQEVKRLERRP